MQKDIWFSKGVVWRGKDIEYLVKILKQHGR